MPHPGKTGKNGYFAGFMPTTLNPTWSAEYLQIGSLCKSSALRVWPPRVKYSMVIEKANSPSALVVRFATGVPSSDMVIC